MGRKKKDALRKCSQTMSIRSAIELYEQMLSNGTIDRQGSAYRRYVELKNRFIEGERIFKKERKTPIIKQKGI